jgi:hypothetical protein
MASAGRTEAPPITVAHGSEPGTRPLGSPRGSGRRKASTIDPCGGEGEEVRAAVVPDRVELPPRCAGGGDVDFGVRDAFLVVQGPVRTTRVWLNELRDRKIRVNVLTPGQVATAKQEELFDEATKAEFESLIPRGQMGRPEEIATVALFLASDDSSYVNGLELVTDGGTTAI